ncbi:hypothetical protein VULLAG_LOCUS13887 [Vulpes lagopus]
MQEVKFTRGWAKGPVSAEEPRRSSAPVLHLPSGPCSLAERRGQRGGRRPVCTGPLQPGASSWRPGLTQSPLQPLASLQLAEAQGRHPQDPGGNKCKSICVQASRLEDPVMLTAHQWQSFAEKWVPQKSPGAKYIHRGT